MICKCNSNRPTVQNTRLTFVFMTTRVVKLHKKTPYHTISLMEPTEFFLLYDYDKQLFHSNKKNFKNFLKKILSSFEYIFNRFLPKREPFESPWFLKKNGSKTICFLPNFQKNFKNILFSFDFKNLQNMAYHFLLIS